MEKFWRKWKRPSLTDVAIGAEVTKSLRIDDAVEKGKGIGLVPNSPKTGDYSGSTTVEKVEFKKENEQPD